MPKPKMKAISPPERVQHAVIIDVDGVQEDVLVADESAAQSLAELVLQAAEQLGTARVPIGAPGVGGDVVVGSDVVLDFAKVKRTEVTVVARSMQTASMGIKK